MYRSMNKRRVCGIWGVWLAVMMLCVGSLLAVVASADGEQSVSGEARVWTDSTGRFTVEASLEEVRDDEVVLKRADGTLITVPRVRLGTADGRYLSTLSAPARDKPVTGTDHPARQPRRTQDAVPDQIGREAITRALAFSCTYEFDRTPLSQALKELAGRHGVPVYLDRGDLEAYGISADHPVSASGRERLDAALTSLLAPLSLEWSIRDDVLCVATAEAHLETRVYAVLQPVPNIEQFLKQLQQAIAPESWSGMGGPGAIRPWPGGAVVIRQTFARHREIENFFEAVLRPTIPAAAKPRRVSKSGRSLPRVALQQAAGCDFLETRLDRTVQYLADEHHVAIRLDNDSLSDFGIAPDTPVTLTLPPIPLESTLNLLVRMLDLDWTILDDSIVITTPEATERLIAPVIYNVGDLLATVRGDLDALLIILYDTVAPASWDTVGGPGSVTPGHQAGTLQVRQTFKTHLEIERLFDDLRVIRRR